MNANQPIGIFDSGVGGLTVARELKRLLPNESIIYFGDTKHVPYGDKSPDVIAEYSIAITKFLLQQNCKAIVIACNTASANAIKDVKKTIDKQALLFDVISPIAEKVAYQLHQKIGIIATKSTIHSHIYRKNIKKLNKHLQVAELATPLLVPIIEEGLTNTLVSKSAIQNYLTHPKLQDIDTLILGCTHYPFMLNEISHFYEKKVQVIDSPLIVANHIKNQLEKQDLLSNSTPEHHFYLSDYTKSFEKLAKKFFGNSINLEIKNLM